MRIEVAVKPGAKKDDVLDLGGCKFKVYVKQRPVEGRANDAVRAAIAGYFGVPRSRVNFLGGLKSKIKRMEIIV